MRRFVAIVVGLMAMMAGVVGASAPARAGTESETIEIRSFSIVSGNTYTKGTVVFSNRSVRVAGEQKSVDKDSARRTSASTYAGGTYLSHAYSQWTELGSEKFSFEVAADVAGGANKVLIQLFGMIDGRSQRIDYKWVLR